MPQGDAYATEEENGGDFYAQDQGIVSITNAMLLQYTPDCTKRIDRTKHGQKIRAARDNRGHII
jgi:hypothetical protein